MSDNSSNNNETQNDGQTHTTTVIEKRGGGAGWAIFAVLAIAVAVGIYFFTQSGAREAVETEAITEAAGEVGDAAGEVGDAAQEAADAVSGN